MRPASPLLAIVLLAVLIIAIAGAVSYACRGTTRASTPAKAPGVYISLGDSVAAGNGASDPRTTSFAALLARDEGMTLQQYAKAGATTQDVLDRQLPPALDLLRAKKVAVVTLVAGGNDLAALVPNSACVEDPLPSSCPLDATLAGVESRLGRVLAQLRAADARVPVVLLAYPNFFSGTGHPFEAPASRVLPRLDDLIRRVAARYPRTAVADAAPSFQGKGATLTHVLDPKFDPHPTDAGHRLIADLFEAALRTLGVGG
ncbi:MAG: SGNH/GDSL hydrolase family protein [Dehalococcoidia bacterium]|nr:SGNH/GDSL hydrolase family protein [Dehalococcoidia bacterium]